MLAMGNKVSIEVPTDDSEKGPRQESVKDSMAQTPTTSQDIVSDGEMVTAVAAKVTDFKDGE